VIIRAIMLHRKALRIIVSLLHRWLNGGFRLLYSGWRILIWTKKAIDVCVKQWILMLSLSKTIQYVVGPFTCSNLFRCFHRRLLGRQIKQVLLI